MKTLRFLFFLSLAGNLAFLALLTSAPRSSPPAPAGGRARPPQAAAARATGDATRAPTATGTAVAAPARGGGSTWAELQAEGLDGLVARLRTAGFPEKTIRAIVESLLESMVAKRRQEFQVSEKEYWKPGGTSTLAIDTPERRLAWEKLNRERNELMKKLLGPDYLLQDEASLNYRRREYGDISREKIVRLQQIQEEFGERRQQIYPGGRPTLPDEVAKLEALDREMRAAFEKVLSPAEVEQYRLRSSPTANYLHENLETFAASEAEYRALFAITRPFVEQYDGTTGTETPQQEEARDAAEKRLLPALEAALGPERFADYQQATNGRYYDLNQLVARLELPIAVARDVAAVQTDITARANQVRRDAALSPDARTAQLTALNQEASTRIAAKLGARGLEAYKQNGGNWLENLVARPRAAPKG